MTDQELDDYLDELFASLLSTGAMGPAASYSREPSGDIIVNVRFILEGSTT